MPTIIDVQKPKLEPKRKYTMPDDQSEAEEVDVRDYESCSDSDSINYRRALAQQNKEIVVLTNRNQELQRDNERMKSDLELVDWYLEVFEGGIDSKDIMQNYMETRARLNSLNSAFVDFRKSAEYEISTLKNKYR